MRKRYLLIAAALGLALIGFWLVRIGAHHFVAVGNTGGHIEAPAAGADRGGVSGERATAQKPGAGPGDAKSESGVRPGAPVGNAGSGGSDPEQGETPEPEGGFVLGPQDGPGDDSAEEASDKGAIHCSIEGLVRLGGEPVAGVEVHLYAMRRGGEFLALESGPPKTDTAGRFGFADVTGNKYRLSVVSQGAFSKGVWILCDNDGEVIQADVDLEPAGVHVTGVLTDLEGTPLAQSSVVARRRTVNMQAMKQALQISVGQDGRFECWLPDAAFSMVGNAVGHHGHVLSIPEGREEVELVFRLERLSGLSGIVIGPEGPQAGVKVSASTRNDDGSSVSNSTDTGSDGRFSLECGPGEASVTAWAAEGWDQQVVPARREGTDAPEVVLELRPGRTVTGHVHLKSGAPAPMVAVGIHTLPSGIGGVVQADIQGDFKAEGLRPGEEVSIFCLRDVRPWQERRLKIGPDQDRVDVLFVPEDE